MARLNVNGKTFDIDVESSMPLLWAIREHVGLTGTKYGCGVAQCGSCTVHVDGVAVRSCVMPVSAAEGKAITTIEGIAQGGRLSKIQQAWIDNQVPQCGYCQSGMIMAVAGLLKDNPNPTDDEIIHGLEGNLCRCTGYVNIIKAVKQAAQALKEQGATRVVAYCTHPVLSGGAVKRIEDSAMDELVVTDTIPLSKEAQGCKKIRVLSVAGLLAETILRISNEDSVSSLFME